MQVLIYSINDVYELENLAKLKAYIDERNAAEAPSAFFVTLNGDFLSPSILALFDKGEAMVQVR